MMYQTEVALTVRRVSDSISILDIQGRVTAAAEELLMNAYAQVSNNGARVIILNFSELEYMNSSGIGLLVTFLIRATRQGQRLLAFGLNEHYRHIFELTRLNEAIQIYETEADTLNAAK